jgi:hypothetical protein
MKYGVLRLSLMVSDEALVLSTHDTFDAAMAEQAVQRKRYGWAYAIVRRLKVPVTVGEFISLRRAVGT